MAVRARPDNLSLVDPAVPAGADASPFDFDELWEHRESLRAICLRMAADPGTADDLVQETFVRALQHADTLDKRASFAPWLATVARRRSIDEIRFRRRLRLVATTPDVESGSAEDPAEQVLKQEMVRRLRTALGELSNRERQLLLRQVTHGLSLAELAEEEDTSVASVRSVLSRARTKLRGSLERGGPLGAAPLPGLVAAVKRRFHRLAARIEGSVPLLTGAGAQFGDVVIAAVVAVALLVAGGAPVPRTVTTTPLPISMTGSTATDTPDEGMTPPPTDQAGFTASTNSNGQPPEQSAQPGDPSPLPDPGDVWGAIPPLPADQADQPEKSGIISLSASEDGSVVFANGLTNQGGAALYRSEDQGHTWTRVGGTYTGSRVIVPPTYPRTRTLFTMDSTKLLRSNDDGETFHPVGIVPLAGGTAFAPDYDTDPRLLISSNPISVYDVDDDTYPTPLPIVAPDRTLGDIFAAPDFNESGRVFVSATSVYEAKPNVPSVFECTNRDGCQRRAVLPRVAGSPRLLDSRTTGLVVAGIMSKLAVSADGGRTFSPASIPPGFFIESIVDGGPGEVLVAGGAHAGQASLFRWAPSTGLWTALGRGSALDLATKAVVHLPSGRIIAAPGLGSGVLCSADNGKTWATRCAA